MVNIMNQAVVIILLFIIVILVFVAAVIIFKIFKGDDEKPDIHISGGINIDNGRIVYDNNYFKAMAQGQAGTVLTNSEEKSGASAWLRIVNKTDGTIQCFRLREGGRITIGREAFDDADFYEIADDLLVSRQHCLLFVHRHWVYVTDLASRNHTYLNGSLLTETSKCPAGSIITVGQTRLKIEYLQYY